MYVVCVICHYELLTLSQAAYLFKAALSELRTELSVKARNDGIQLRSTASLIRREVDSLSQKLKEDIGTLKHECVQDVCFLFCADRLHSIEMDMNNRKAENRSDQKGYDIAIEVRVCDSADPCPS